MGIEAARASFFKLGVRCVLAALAAVGGKERGDAELLKVVGGVWKVTGGNAEVGERAAFGGVTIGSKQIEIGAG